MNGTIRYTIRPYDTIWMLAQVFNTTVDDIMEVNPGIEPRNLLIGQVVNIRPGYQYYPSTEEDMDNLYGEDDSDDMDNLYDDGVSDYMDPGMDSGMDPGMDPGMDFFSGDDFSDMSDLDMEDLDNYFRLLWQQHEIWTMMAVIGIVQNLPQTDLILQRLLRNPVDFANALAPFYGEEAARAFETLFTEHLTIAGDVVKAANAGDNNALAEADKKWYENADEIAALLGSINPYWAEEDWAAMLHEHLDLLSTFVAYMVAERYEEAIMQFDYMEAQALEMADMMAFGISEQFPG